MTLGWWTQPFSYMEQLMITVLKNDVNYLTYAIIVAVFNWAVNR